jgi:hypothetical protein
MFSGARSLAGISALCVLALGTPASAQIAKADNTPYAAPKDQALVVFTRPRRNQASETEFRIVTQAGRCIALLENGMNAAAELWPGTHMLMVVTGTAPPTVQLFQAKLSARKTYVIKLRARVNVKSPVEIEPIRRADQAMEAFPEELLAQRPFRQELRKCTEWVSWKRTKIEPRAEIAKQKWDDAPPETRDEVTVHRKDGWSADQIYPE